MKPIIESGETGTSMNFENQQKKDKSGADVDSSSEQTNAAISYIDLEQFRALIDER